MVVPVVLRKQVRPHLLLSSWWIGPRTKSTSLRAGIPEGTLLTAVAIAYDEIGEWNKSDKIYLQLIEKNNLDAQALNNFA